MIKTPKTVFAFLYSIVIIFIIIMSTVPPVSRDAQTHHLALPKIWLSEGILSEVPEMEFSYYPQLVDLLYMLPVAIDFDIAAKYIHFGFGLGCALLIFLYIRRFIGSIWGSIGGLMFLTVPVIIKLSVTVYVDLGLLFFFTASLFSALIWLEDTNKSLWLVLSGVCSGLAMSTKYNAMLSVAILALLIIFFFYKTTINKNHLKINIIKYMSIFSFVALLVYSPWLIRNYSLTGNPIYPLYQSIFSQFSEEKIQDEYSKIEGVTDSKPLTERRMQFNESLLYSIAVPIRIFYEGEDDNPQYFDGRLNPFLLLFPLILFIKKKVRWQNQFLVVFVILTLLYTLLATSMRIRYVITIVSPMIVLSVFGLYHLNKLLRAKIPSTKTASIVLITVISSYFVYNISYTINLFNKIDPIPYLSGEISRNEYLTKNIPHYSLNKLANKLVSADKKLLGVYLGNRRYYIDVPVTLESELLFKLAQKSNNAAELKQQIFDRGITHMLVRLDLFNKELSYRDNKTKMIITQFISSYVKLVETEEVFGLYEITN